jgi:dTDP-4-dehydrorhamnose 3,5-epimerase
LQIIETVIRGAFLLKFDPVHDSRGYSVRRYCRKEFEKIGLCCDFEFDLSSFNKQKHTLRGMHFQCNPFEETKLVTCSRGAIFDVVVDLRENSDTKMNWHACELDEESNQSLYIPTGCAHGYITLLDNSQVDYKLNAEYSPHHALGFRFDDPVVSIEWPFQPAAISERDLKLPYFSDELLKRRSVMPSNFGIGS